MNFDERAVKEGTIKVLQGRLAQPNTVLAKAADY